MFLKEFLIKADWTELYLYEIKDKKRYKKQKQKKIKKIIYILKKWILTKQ